MEKVKRVRPILQMEITECGAASLAMILNYYGKTVTLEELRRECGVSRNGVNAKSIVKAAEYHGLKVRTIRVNVEGAKKVKMPVVIHWNMDHFLVLCGFNKKGAVLADPAHGKRTVSMREFSKSFTGIVLEFTPTDGFKKDGGEKNNSDYIADCTKKFLPSAVYFVLLELCAIIGSAAALFLNSVFIDKILVDGNTQNLTIIFKTLLCAGLIAAASAALNENIKYKIGKHLNMLINSGFIGRIMKLPIEFFLQRSVGDLTNRQNSNMQLGINISCMMSPFFGYIMQIIIYFILIAVFDVHIALIGVLCAAANIAALIIRSKKYEEKMCSHIRDMGALQNDISQTVDMIETIKACGAEDAVFTRLIASGTQALNTKTQIDKAGVCMGSLFGFLNTFTSSVVLIVGIWKILCGDMTTGTLIALQSLVAAMMKPLGNIVNTGIEMQTVKGEMARANDVMRYDEDDKFLSNHVEQTKEIDGAVKLENIAFAYNPLDAPLIEGFNLTIKKGGSVALTGESGSGKSTVAKIIAGIYSEGSGRVSFGGVLRNEINRQYFYSKAAMVSQNIRLFEGTVLDNITMWDESISYDEVVAAAKAACIHDDIIARHGGYREIVTENGKNFSGGQRQRIEIARALVKKPSIIIMDEATSALDTDTEEKVMNNIKELGITRIIVAHRLSTIMDSDEIIVMEAGKIAERGNHTELMAKNGAYCALVRSVS